MKVYLDGERIAQDSPGLATALRQGVAEAESKGRIVIEATIDGQPLTDEQLEHPTDDPGLGGEVHLVSAEPRSLVRMTLLDAGDALLDAKEKQAECARLVQAGSIEGAMQILTEAIAIWQAARDVVSRSADLLSIPLDEVKVRGEGEPPPPSTSVTEHIAGLTASLEELKRSVTMEDWSALADVLAFDLDQQADRWRGVMRSMADYVRALD